MIVVLPVFQPGESLPALVASLRALDPDTVVVVVDDGSDPAAEEHIAACANLNCVVLRHPVNRGKGAALKTAFTHLLATGAGEPVVCADADGQHHAADISRVADDVAASDGIVLGTRRFRTDGVPLRSRIGNVVTRILFRAATGVAVRDTQTGLRGFPAGLLPWLLSVPGDRFDYEMNVLLEAARTGRRLGQVAVETVYLAGNASSHFGSLADSARVYRSLVRYVVRWGA